MRHQLSYEPCIALSNQLSHMLSYQPRDAFHRGAPALLRPPFEITFNDKTV